MELGKQHDSDSDEIELLIEHLKEKAEKLKISDMEIEKVLKIEEIEENMEGVEQYSETFTKFFGVIV